jgi:hypothetical protein
MVVHPTIPKNAFTMVEIAALLPTLVFIAISPYQIAKFLLRVGLVMVCVTTARSMAQNACTMVEIAALLTFLVLIAISPYHVATLFVRKSLVMAFVVSAVATTPPPTTTPPNVDMTVGTASSKGIHRGAPKRKGQVVVVDGLLFII